MTQKAKSQSSKREHIVTHVASLPDGTYIIEHPDGRLERREGETDWKRVKSLTDEEIAAAVRDDPDAAPLDVDWSDTVAVPPKKTAISIRVDEDVLDYFKRQGGAYQRRMNAVLRTYMEHRRKKRA